MAKNSKNSKSFKVQNLSVDIAGQRILKNISFELGVGEFLAVLGPNGSGKSTLLRALAGLSLGGQRTTEGTFFLGGLNGLNQRMADKRIWAQHCGLLSNPELPWVDMNVDEYVELGRYPYAKCPIGLSDLNQVSNVLEFVSAADFKNRSVHSLSSGEFQRVALARVLMQLNFPELPGLDLRVAGPEILPKILLLDEPLAHMDIYYQHYFLKRLKKLKRFRAGSHDGSKSLNPDPDPNPNLSYRALADQDMGIICVIHDVSLAAKYADKFLLLKDGEILSFGDNSVLTSKNLSDLFGVDIAEFYGEKIWEMKF
jgi:iron complex transport system ATP-binding protein